MFQYTGDHRALISFERSATIMVKAKMETVIQLLGRAQTQKSTVGTKSACASLVSLEIGANGQHVQIERKGTHRWVKFALVQLMVGVRTTRYASATQASLVQNVAVPAQY